MKVITWVLGAVLTAAPLMYAQQSADQSTQPQTPTATDQNSAAIPNNSATQPGAATMPQSDATPAGNTANQSSSNNALTNNGATNTASNNNMQAGAQDQSVIYGTGLTAAELKQIGYTDDEINQMRSESQMLMASNTGTSGTAAGNQDQGASAASGVSNPADTNNNATANEPQKASSNHAGLWGLLGLLGLLGLAGRATRQQVVRHDVDVDARDRDRMRMMAEHDAANRAARDREIVASTDYRDQDIVAAGDREVAARDRDLAGESAVQRNLRERELRDRMNEDVERDRRVVAENELRDRRVQGERRVHDISEGDRNRRRSA